MTNKIKHILPLIFVFAVLITVKPVSATITVTISAPSSVTQGSNIPITASFVVGSGESGSFYFTCDQTAAGEVDPEAGYSISSSTSKTYTFTPSQATTYTNCKVSDGGTQSSSTTTIKSVAPSSLTVTGSPSASTNTSFTLSINITNPTADTVTTTYTLSCGSVGTCSGDQTSANINIATGSTTALSWTVTASSSGTITFQLGSNSQAFTSTVTLPSAATTTTTTSPGGVGGTTTSTITSTTTSTSTTTTVPGATTTSTTISGTTTTTVSEGTIGSVVSKNWPLIIGVVAVASIAIVAFMVNRGLIELPIVSNKWRELYKRYKKSEKE